MSNGAKISPKAIRTIDKSTMAVNSSLMKFWTDRLDNSLSACVISGITVTEMAPLIVLNRRLGSTEAISQASVSAEVLK